MEIYLLLASVLVSCHHFFYDDVGNLGLPVGFVDLHCLPNISIEFLLNGLVFVVGTFEVVSDESLGFALTSGLLVFTWALF